MKTECQRHPGMCASDPLCADHYCPGHPRNGGGRPAKTGWPAGLMQDDDRGLSRWLASRPDARKRAREAAELIQGNSSASKPGAHMPITFEGDEPDEISLWQWVADMTPTWADVAGGLAVLALVAAVATYFFNH